MQGWYVNLKMLRRKSKTQFVNQEHNMQNAIALLNYLKCIAPQQLTLVLTRCKVDLIRMSWVPYMTLTPLLTLTHRRQVKENFIILKKLSTRTFSIADWAIDNIHNF
jgi:hypothetical protein